MKVSRQGKQILEIDHISKTFRDKKVIRDFSYTFKKGDKIGLTGKNGTGKSTFLNIITNELKADIGSIKVGETTVYGYYHQSGLYFDESERVIDVVKNIAEYITMSDGTTISASQLLTHFLFPPKKQHGFVSLLSGGEKKRLHLMKVLIKNPNFLILDEPTNDLDIDTLNVLEEFLENYPGVLVLVSHDRYLVDKLTDQLFVLEGGGNIRIYNGNYSSYRIEQEEIKAAEKENKNTPIVEEKKDKPKTKLTYQEQKELDNLEQEISVLENSIEKLTNQLNGKNLNTEEIITISKTIEENNKTLEETTFKWIALSE
jgi:ATP-binding cassette subfamily F protein uup